MSRFNFTIHPVSADLDIIQFASGPMQNLQYMIHDRAAAQMVAIDPAWNTEPYIDIATQLGARITQIWITHGHFDHVNQLDNLIQACGEPEVVLYKSPLVTPKSERIKRVANGDALQFGTHRCDVLHTPGHSPDSICFLFAGHIICGDLLFIDACGRCDLPGSNVIQMQESLRRMSQLPPETGIYPGHDYGPTQIDTIGQQLHTNPHLISASRRTMTKG